MVVILQVILTLTCDCNNCTPLVKINVAHILSMVIIFEVISGVADDCNSCSQNQRSPYFEYCIYIQSHIGTRK